MTAAPAWLNLARDQDFKCPIRRQFDFGNRARSDAGHYRADVAHGRAGAAFFAGLQLIEHFHGVDRWLWRSMSACSTTCGVLGWCSLGDQLAFQSREQLRQLADEVLIAHRIRTFSSFMLCCCIMINIVSAIPR